MFSYFIITDLGEGFESMRAGSAVQVPSRHGAKRGSADLDIVLNDFGNLYLDIQAIYHV